MMQHDFHFFVNLMTFVSPKENDKIFPFHIYFTHLCKISNPKERKTHGDMCI
jgi:hypothetical protein